MRTLLVYLHGIGDNIMLSGVLKEYKRRWPDELIDLIVLNRGCAAVWAGNPFVNAVKLYEGKQPHFWNPVEFRLRSYWRVRSEMRQMREAAGYAKTFFPSIQTLPEIVYHLTGTYGGHKIERIAREMSLPARTYPYDLYVGREDVKTADTTLHESGVPAGARLAVVHPFSGHSVKKLSSQGVANMLSILKRRGFLPLVVGADSEKAQFDPAWNVCSTFGLSFGVLVEILRRAVLFTGTDSAVAHLAGFANTEVLAILSPKLKPERYLPISERAQIRIIRTRSGSEDAWLREWQQMLP